MTPVIVATHTDGVVRVYCREPNGTVNQTGRFVADQIEPPALANLIADLADTLHWNGDPVATTSPARLAPPPPIPIGSGKSKPKGNFRNRSRAGRTEIAERRAAVIAHLTAKGEATAMAVGSALFANKPDSVGKARKLLDQLVADGLVTRVHRSDGPMRFRAVEP
jgi:hypothetical protein